MAISRETAAFLLVIAAGACTAIGSCKLRIRIRLAIATVITVDGCCPISFHDSRSGSCVQNQS